MATAGKTPQQKKIADRLAVKVHKKNYRYEKQNTFVWCNRAQKSKK